MSALADPDLARLVKLLGMLGSAAVGERAAAALKVTEFMQTHGWAWDELLTQEEALPAVSVTVGDDGAQSDVFLTKARTEGYQRGYIDGQRVAAQQQAMAAAQAQAAMHNQAYAAQQAYQPPYNTGLGGLGQAAQTAPKPARTWQDAAREIMALPGWPLMQVHRPKEADFVQSLLARNWTNLTTKQEVWLRDICLRLGVEQW